MVVSGGSWEVHGQSSFFRHLRYCAGRRHCIQAFHSDAMMYAYRDRPIAKEVCWWCSMKFLGQFLLLRGPTCAIQHASPSVSPHHHSSWPTCFSSPVLNHRVSNLWPRRHVRDSVVVNNSTLQSTIPQTVYFIQVIPVGQLIMRLDINKLED